MVAIMLGVTIEDLCGLYRAQFAVLYSNDHAFKKSRRPYVYDANGRQLPTPVRKAWEKRKYPTSNEDMPLSERTHTHPDSGVSYVYDLPFRIRDRESDFRRIYSALTEQQMRAIRQTKAPPDFFTILEHQDPAHDLDCPPAQGASADSLTLPSKVRKSLPPRTGL